MNSINQNVAIKYYDRFSKVYNFFSPKAYYHKARKKAVSELELSKTQVVLNVPCGTGQNFEYFQDHLMETGKVVGVDISTGMLKKAEKLIGLKNWKNIFLYNEDVTNLNEQWLKNKVGITRIDSILCDLGLSGFPEWETVIDNLLSMLKPNGKIVIMDWYIDKPSLRGSLVKWIGKGAVDRPIWQYLETQVKNFSLDSTFNRGGVFVASGSKKKFKNALSKIQNVDPEVEDYLD